MKKSELKLNIFMEVYEKHLKKTIDEKNLPYLEPGILKVLNRVKEAISKGSYTITSSYFIQETCKELGIPFHIKAINKYLNE